MGPRAGGAPGGPHADRQTFTFNLKARRNATKQTLLYVLNSPLPAKEKHIKRRMKRVCLGSQTFAGRCKSLDPIGQTFTSVLKVRAGMAKYLKRFALKSGHIVPNIRKWFLSRRGSDFPMISNAFVWSSSIMDQTLKTVCFKVAFG